MATTRESINSSVRRDYESVVVAAGPAGVAFTSTISPGQAFKLVSVLVHASAVPGGANVLSISLISAHGTTEYDAVFATQDMNGLVDYAYHPTTPMCFSNGDQILVAQAADWVATWTVQVVWESI